VYLKFLLSGDLGTHAYYESFNGFKFYDRNNNAIVISRSTNLFSQNYNTRYDSASIDYWFNPITDAELVPYMSGGNSGRVATVIVNIPVNIINKIDLYSYCNAGGAKYIDIYCSNDNVTYTFSERITFTAASQKISTTKVISFPYNKILLKNGLKVLSVANSNLVDTRLTTPTEDDYENFGMDNLSAILTPITSVQIKPVESTVGTGKVYTAPIDASLLGGISKIKVK